MRRRAAIFVLTVAALSLGAWELFCQDTLKVPRQGPNIPLVSQPGDDPFWSAVSLTARDRVRLEASFVTPRQSNGNCVLVVHGIGAERSSMQKLVRLFASHGYRVPAPDNRAHGLSGGDLVTYGLLEKFDALDWAHWLRDRGCEAVYGFGESLGASILIEAAGAEPAFRALVVECPFADLRTVAEARLQLYGRFPGWIAKAGVESAMLYARVRFGVDLSHISPIEDIARVQVPVLLIHGLADTRTALSNSEALQKAAPHAMLWLVPGAGHVRASSTAPVEFNRRVLEWFAYPNSHAWDRPAGVEGGMDHIPVRAGAGSRL